MRGHARAWAILAGLATALAGQGTHASAEPGPFGALEWRDGVTTSRNGYAVWVSVKSTGHRAKLPGHASELSAHDHFSSLHAHCRAPGGGSPEKLPPTPPEGALYLDDHPEQPDAYTVNTVEHWMRELTGRTREEVPVQVRIGPHGPLDGRFVRRLTTYATPRPGVDITLDGDTVLEAIAGGVAITVRVEGADIHLEGRYTPSANAQRAARLMQSACAGHQPADQDE